MLRIGLVAALALGLAGAPAAGGVADILRSGDMEALAATVESLYEAQGVDLPDSVVWDFQDYRTTYSFYEPDERIVSGAIPAQDQVAAYWAAWTSALTGGVWSPDGFFLTNGDAADMARMHQFILALHEAAHAVTYRYDPGHLSRHGVSVGCREYYADRLVATLLQDLGRREPEMERLRRRYLDLSVSMGDAIPDAYRARPTTWPEFEADCTVMFVANPDPSDLRAYASAWFNRYRALLPATLPAPSETVARHLTGRLAARMAHLPPAPGAAAARVETLRGIDPFAPRWASTLAGDGSVWSARARGRDAAGRLLIDLGAPPAASIVEGVPMLRGNDTITGLAALPDGRLLLSMGDGAAGILLRLERDSPARNTWRAEVLARSKGPARVLAADRTALWVEDRTGGGWRTRPVDPIQGIVSRPLDLPAAEGRPVGGLDDGRLLVSDERSLVVVGPGGVQRLAGSGLPGNRDGAALGSEFGWIVTARPQPDGGIDLIDMRVVGGGASLRAWRPGL